MFKKIKKIFPTIAEIKLLKLEILLSFMSGILLNLAFPNIDINWLAWISLIPFLTSLYRVNSFRHSMHIGFVFGFTFYYCNFFWLNNLIIYNLFIPLGVIFLGIYCALYVMLFSGVFYFIKREFPKLIIFIVPLVWVFTEYLKILGDLGFPWGNLAYTQWNQISIIQISSILGMYGVSYLVILINLSLAELFVNFKKKSFKSSTISILFTVIISSLILAYGYKVKNEKPNNNSTKLKIAVLQPNIDQLTKMNSFYDQKLCDELFFKVIRLTKEVKGTDADLLIFPETTITDIELATNQELKAYLQAISKDIETPFLLGGLNKDEKSFYNSAFYVDGNDGWGEIYDKIQLVPFGETVPYLNKIPFFQEFIVGIESFGRGKEHTIFKCNDVQFGALICFESTFPELSRILVNKGASFLTVITNDAWYLDSRGPYQHCAISVLRAVETRRWLARSANTGISCIISPIGEIKTYLKYGVEGITDYEIEPRTDITFYTKYGDIFAKACSILSLIMIMIIIFRKKIKNDNMS